MADRDHRGAGLAAAAAKGAAAGLIGVVAMTLGEKFEQSITRRPDSFVPGRALLALLGRRPGDNDKPVRWNHAMHWATGAGLGALRGVWAVTGMRGRRADLAHTAVRLAFDQTVENLAGVGAPPHTWPRSEQVVDVAHKAVYAFTTGLVADRWLPPVLETRRGTTSH